MGLLLYCQQQLFKVFLDLQHLRVRGGWVPENQGVQQEHSGLANGWLVFQVLGSAKIQPLQWESSQSLKKKGFFPSCLSPFQVHEEFSGDSHGFSAFMAQILQQLLWQTYHQLVIQSSSSWLAGYCPLTCRYWPIDHNPTLWATCGPRDPWPAPPRCCPSGPFRWLPGPKAWATVNRTPFSGR